MPTPTATKVAAPPTPGGTGVPPLGSPRANPQPVQARTDLPELAETGPGAMWAMAVAGLVAILVGAVAYRKTRQVP